MQVTVFSNFSLLLHQLFWWYETSRKRHRGTTFKWSLWHQGGNLTFLRCKWHIVALINRLDGCSRSFPCLKGSQETSVDRQEAALTSKCQAVWRGACIFQPLVHHEKIKSIAWFNISAPKCRSEPFTLLGLGARWLQQSEQEAALQMIQRR